MSSPWQQPSTGVREVHKVNGTSRARSLIICAAQGQGESHARTFARAGADLVICDLPQDTSLAGVFYELGDRCQARSGGTGLSRGGFPRPGTHL
jgi:hypothetical protein